MIKISSVDKLLRDFFQSEGTSTEFMSGHLFLLFFVYFTHRILSGRIKLLICKISYDVLFFGFIQAGKKRVR